MQIKTDSPGLHQKNLSISFFPKTNPAKKAHEAEDLLKSRRPPLLRQKSAPLFNKGNHKLTGDEEINKRSGALWTCIKRTQDIYGGYIYTLKLKDCYDDVTPHTNRAIRAAAAKQRYAEIYPATEALGTEVYINNLSLPENELFNRLIYIEFNKLTPEIQNLLTQTPLTKPAFLAHIRPDMLWRINQARILGLLGYRSHYSDSGVYLNLPDKETLLARWTIVRERVAGLPDIDIASCEGIAEDLEFVEAFFTCDVLLSSGKEFVHDHTQHIMPMLFLMIDSAVGVDPSYQQERARLEKMVMKSYRRIMITKMVLEDHTGDKLGLSAIQVDTVRQSISKMEAALGSVVDTITASPTYANTSKFFNGNFIERHVKSIWENTNWQAYWKRRFGDANTNNAVISSVWDQLGAIEKEFDHVQPRASLTKP
jgi:hypothetical protein